MNEIFEQRLQSFPIVLIFYSGKLKIRWFSRSMLNRIEWVVALHSFTVTKRATSEYLHRNHTENTRKRAETPNNVTF